MEKNDGQRTTERIQILDHNKPGSRFVTPHGVVETDEEGFGNVSPAQLAYLKTRGGLRITTREVPSAKPK